MVNWNEVETAYLTGGISYREIAEIYGVDISTVKRRGKRGNWVEKRAQHGQQIRQEILEADKAARVDRFSKLAGVADKLLQRVEELTVAEEISPASIKTLSEALKNIRDAQMLKETNRAEADNQTIRVVLDGVGEFVS